MSLPRRLSLVLALVACTVASAGDIEAGKAAATPCTACHGEGGGSPIANYPILAGQHENYLVHSLRSYRDGTRSNQVMVQQLANLTDIDLDNLAAYFAAQPTPLK